MPEIGEVGMLRAGGGEETAFIFTDCGILAGVEDSGLHLGQYNIPFFCSKLGPVFLLHIKHEIQATCQFSDGSLKETDSCPSVLVPHPAQVLLVGVPWTDFFFCGVPINGSLPCTLPTSFSAAKSNTEEPNGLARGGVVAFQETGFACATDCVAGLSAIRLGEENVLGLSEIGLEEPFETGAGVDFETWPTDPWNAGTS